MRVASHYSSLSQPPSLSFANQHTRTRPLLRHGGALSYHHLLKRTCLDARPPIFRLLVATTDLFF